MWQSSAEKSNHMCSALAEVVCMNGGGCGRHRSTLRVASSETSLLHILHICWWGGRVVVWIAEKAKVTFSAIFCAFCRYVHSFFYKLGPVFILILKNHIFLDCLVGGDGDGDASDSLEYAMAAVVKCYLQLLQNCKLIVTIEVQLRSDRMHHQHHHDHRNPLFPPNYHHHTSGWPYQMKLAFRHLKKFLGERKCIFCCLFNLPILIHGCHSICVDRFLQLK